jgi:transposase InsO family protein
VVRTGTRCLPKHIWIPRSTVSTWRRRGQRPVVTVEPLDQDRQQLLDTIVKLDRRVRIIAAVVRVLLGLLRASGFTLAGERLPEGAAKAGILRAITSATPFLPLAVILRIARLEPGRYHRWNRAATAVCGLDDHSSCPRTSPSQLTSAEVAEIKDMVLAPEKRHVSLRTLALHAQRIGKVFASTTTWAKLVRVRGWIRPRQRVHPPKPTVGVRAAGPNQVWHIDVTILKLLDGTKAYLHAIIDNYSRKILAWTVAERLDPTATCQLLLAAGKHMVFAGLPLLFADSGIENINSAVDATLLSACLERVLAQVDVAYSNSMIEAFWRSLKHQWLYLNSLDSIERLRALVKFFVEEHNTQMPHSAFAGQTPDEMYFGTAVGPAGATGGGPEQGTGGAPCSKPGDDLQRVQWSASQPSRIANSSMISALTLLRTPLCERSAHTAGLSARAWERRWGWPMRCGASRQGMILSRGHGTVVVERPWRFRSITRQ